MKNRCFNKHLVLEKNPRSVLSSGAFWEAPVLPWKNTSKDALKDSSVFLVIFSENYASSTWCLNELLEIMDCKKNGEADVIPVFYRIDPSYVRKQTRSYKTAFAKHKKQSEERIQKWKDALSHAANLSGFDSRAYSWPPSLQALLAGDCFNLQEFCVPFKPSKPGSRFSYDSILDLGCSGLSKLPSSILQMRNLNFFHFPICESLMDLPENFARCIRLSHSMKHEHDSLITLQKLLSTPGFRSVKCLSLETCHGLSGLPDNITLLNSLVYLGLHDCHGLSGLPNNISLLNSLCTLDLRNCTVISLPESIKQCRNLTRLVLRDCAMLQSIPGLPHSIKGLLVEDCKSLQTFNQDSCKFWLPNFMKFDEPPHDAIVAIILSDASVPYHCCFFWFANCMKLDDHSYDAILKDAIVRIAYAAKRSQSAFRNGQIYYCLPARRDKFRDLFRYHSPQDLLNIELPPPNVLGFSLYLVLSVGQSRYSGCMQKFGCECYLETSLGLKICVFRGEFVFNHVDDFRIMSDHVFLLYDSECCEHIMEALKVILDAISESRSSFKAKITLKFFCWGVMGEKLVINGCGLRWICPLETGGCKSKRIGEIHELDRVERSQSDEPPTKKCKQCDRNLAANEPNSDAQPLSPNHIAPSRPKRTIRKPAHLKDFI